jgi:hypothetical protein
MKTPLTIFAILLYCAFGAHAQISPVDHKEQVKASISRLSSNRKSVSLLLRSLLEFRGKVVSLSDDEFGLRFKNKEGKTLRKSIDYSEVLALNGGGERLSQIPAVTRKPHGTWDDIGKVFSGTKILIALKDGRHIKGYSNSVNDTHLVLLDRESEQRLDLPRDQVAAFVAFTLSRGGAKKGAKWAAKELGREPILGALGMGVGALVGALTKAGEQPILIYSR